MPIGIVIAGLETQKRIARASHAQSSPGGRGSHDSRGQDQRIQLVPIESLDEGRAGRGEPCPKSVVLRRRHPAGVTEDAKSLSNVHRLVALLGLARRALGEGEQVVERVD